MELRWLIFSLFILLSGAGCGQSGAGSADVAGKTVLETAPISAVQSNISSAKPPVSIPTVRPEMFGTGLPAMLAAYRIAITGIPLELTAGQTYDMGSAAPGVALLPSTGAKLRVIGNGATITMNTDAMGQTHLFDLTNPLYAQFENVTFADSGADITQSWRGAHFIFVTASGSTNGYGNITLKDVRTTSGISPLTVFGTSATSRLSNITFQGNCIFSNTYYGPVFQNQGDNVSGTWTCINCRRAYYVYGATNHDVSVKIQHDGIASGSTGAVEIVSDTTVGAVYTDTRSIRLHAEFSGSVAHYSSCVNLVNKGDSGAIQNDIRIDLNLGYTVWTGSTYKIYFQDYNSEGVEQTTTNNMWDNIVLTGDFYSNTESFAAAIYPICVKPAQSTVGSLKINVDAAGRKGFGTTIYPGFVTQYNSGTALSTIQR
jgi:hypothetical protein